MRQIINASNFDSSQPTSSLLVYSRGSSFPTSIQTFAEALTSASWVENYHPFAFVIVDQISQEILLVRDHLGIEPLYYAFQSNRFIFGNNLPAILKHFSKLPPLNEEQVLNLFAERRVYSDQTLHEGILRVEPGHWLHIKPNGTIHKQAFWQLEPEGEELYYAADETYVEHFTELLHEGINGEALMHHKVAAEFSAGMDSSAVYCAAASQGINPTLFMHMAAPNSQAAKIYNDQYERAFLEHFNISSVQRVTAEVFDPLQVFQDYTTWFAGPAPHIFYMFAQPLHQAVADGNYSILLSGFGGDEVVSGRIPNHFILPSLMQKKQYRLAWETVKKNNTEQLLRRILSFIKYTSPVAYRIFYELEEYKLALSNKIKSFLQREMTFRPPFFSTYFPNLRAAEWAFLQGAYNYNLRMRIESSSIVGQQLGFQFRYPLLYPKLLAFFLSIPLSQKKHEGKGRYLLQRYLKQQIGTDLFTPYKKNEGLHIFSAAYEKFITQYKNNFFQEYLGNISYPHLIPDRRVHKQIAAFMLKNYLNNNR